mgnify:CR=1 FL=1
MSKIRLHGSSSGYMEIAPPAAASSATVTLPNSAGEVLLSDGSAASLTQIPAANLVGVCTSGLTKTGGFGLISQVVQTVRTTTASTGGTSFAKIDDLSASITTTGSNKVLIRAFIHFGTDAGHVVQFRLARTTSGTENDELIIGSAASSRTRASMGGLAANANWEINPDSIEFLDSPGAGSHEYYLKWRVGSGSGTAYLNRSQRDLDNGSATRVPSVITAMEITV